MSYNLQNIEGRTGKKGADTYHYGGRYLPLWGQILTTMGADTYHLTQKNPVNTGLCGAGNFQYY